MVVVEVTRKAYLASVVPVIVNAILNEHQVVADIVAFVSHGDFPRSRLGEKQRGKVLASWVTRKLRTIAQFSIRDMEGGENPFGETPQHRTSRSSKPGSTMGNGGRRSSVMPDTDSATVPRSPAPILVEQPEAASPHSLPDQGAMNSPTVYAEPAQSIPQIAEPTRPGTSSTAGHPDPSLAIQNNAPPANLGNPDFGFDFGDFAHAATTSPIGESNVPAPATGAPLPFRPSPRTDSLPSQQQQHQQKYSAFPGAAASERPLSRDTPSHPGDEHDWPQEALMYQSTLGIDEPQGVHRAPSSTSQVQRRYDGSEYGI